MSVLASTNAFERIVIDRRVFDPLREIFKLGIELKQHHSQSGCKFKTERV